MNHIDSIKAAALCLRAKHEEDGIEVGNIDEYNHDAALVIAAYLDARQNKAQFQKN